MTAMPSYRDQYFGLRLARVPTTPAGKVSPVDPKSDVPGTFTSDLGMKFVPVPKGTGWLGGGGGKEGEMKVEFKESFFLGMYEVTQGEWEAVMGSNPSAFGRGTDAAKDIPAADVQRFPVENVSWDECQEFVRKLNNREKATGWVYRLPTEAEWEYACRGGPVGKADSTFDYYFAKPTNVLLPELANINNVLKRPGRVGSYEPNVLGLHDMHGNVHEWCDDAREGADGESRRAGRGGHWFSTTESSRAAFRNSGPPSARASFAGLRLARVPTTLAGK